MTSPSHPLSCPCSKRGVLLDITSLPDAEPLSRQVGTERVAALGIMQAMHAPAHLPAAFAPALLAPGPLTPRTAHRPLSPPPVATLLPQERHLCAAERYLPAQYLAIKAAALKLQEARGRLPRQDFLRLPFQVDPGRMQR